MKPLVSVVTPFYNTDEYLSECIESVLAQTYENWEYVLVDNKSTDRSSEIAQRYAEKDRRLRLIHNEKFLTQVENYNHALRQISPNSKYCKLVQADDWIYPNCLKEMVEAAVSSDRVSLVGAYSLYELLPPDGDRPYIGGTGLRYTDRIVPGKQVLRDYLLRNQSLFGSPTTVMYRAEDVRSKHEFFDTASPVEDMQASFDLLHQGDCAFVHQVLTFNRRQSGSLYWDASQYNSFALNAMILVHRYGPALFSAAEYSKALRIVEGTYNLCLAHALLQGRGAGFWRYHAQGLATIGLGIQGFQVARHIPRALVEYFGNPKATIGRIWRAFVRKRRQRSQTPRSGNAAP